MTKKAAGIGDDEEAAEVVIELKSYEAQWLLSHNGTDFNAGELIELSDDDASQLLKSGVIKSVMD
jgi:hypothetical protein